jgi:serine protease DegQ
VVDYLDAGGPAERAGVRAKDVLLAVEGKPLAAGALMELRRLLSEKGKTVSLRLRRGKETIEATLRLEDWWAGAPGR